MKNPDLARIILGASSDIHFPDVLPWLDLYYRLRVGKRHASLNVAEIDEAIDTLHTRAVMEFGGQAIVWEHELQGSSLILFSSTWRERIVPALVTDNTVPLQEALRVLGLRWI